jgi:hypothetical protein
LTVEVTEDARGCAALDTGLKGGFALFASRYSALGMRQRWHQQ